MMKARNIPTILVEIDMTGSTTCMPCRTQVETRPLLETLYVDQGIDVVGEKGIYVCGCSASHAVVLVDNSGNPPQYYLVGDGTRHTPQAMVVQFGKVPATYADSERYVTDQLSAGTARA